MRPKEPQDETANRPRGRGEAVAAREALHQRAESAIIKGAACGFARTCAM